MTTRTKVAIAIAIGFLLTQASAPAEETPEPVGEGGILDVYEYEGTYRKMVCGSSVQISKAEYDQLAAAKYHDTCGSIGGRVVDAVSSWTDRIMKWGST